MKGSFRTFFHYKVILPLVDFIYPPVCLSCSAPIPGVRPVCENCLSRIRILQYDSTMHTELRRHCMSLYPALSDVYAGYLFEQGDVLQHLIHALKYSHLDSLGVYLGKELGLRLDRYYGVNSDWSLVPVPLHHVKKRERGYNQAEKIAAGISEVTGARVHPGTIIRRRHTRSQTTLSFDQRRENVAGAFSYVETQHRLRSKIAIVDDVITTGSTIVECASSIPPRLYRELYLFSVAYAV
jgi:competence protein ComFC